jgi:hypothetical protein
MVVLPSLVEFGCYEVAKAIVEQQSSSSKGWPGATKAMDVCAFGWMVWKMMNNNQTLWDHLGISNDEAAIISTLANMTQAELKQYIEYIFPNPVNTPLRHWLEEALQVVARARPAATTLKSNYSLFGHRESTINVNVLTQKLVSEFDIKLTLHAEGITSRLLDRIDELSVEIKEQFASLYGVLTSCR